MDGAYLPWVFVCTMSCETYTILKTAGSGPTAIRKVNE